VVTQDLSMNVQVLALDNTLLHITYGSADHNSRWML